MNVIASKQVLTDLWRAAGHDAAALDSVTLTGQEPALPSSFAVGVAAQATIAASALAAAELWRLRTGRQQHVSVDMRHAAIEFRSGATKPISSGEVYLRNLSVVKVSVECVEEFI